MKICIYDTDDLVYSALMKSICECFITSETFSVKICNSPQQVLTLIENSDIYDVYYINTDANGILLPEIIKRQYPTAIIILLSENPEMMYNAFTVEALYCLIKPFSEEKFSDIFKHSIAKYKNLNPKLYLRRQNERYIVPINEILYIEAYDRHITVHTKEAEYSYTGQMQSIFDKVAIYDFVRIHQGYCVNMKHIKCFYQKEVVLTDGTKLMVSTRKKHEALMLYDNFLKKSNIQYI